MYSFVQQCWRLLPENWRATGGPFVGGILYALFARLVPKGRVRAVTGDVTIVGFHTACVGLGRGAQLQAQAMKAAGVAVETIDLSDYLERTGWSPSVSPPSPTGAGTVITHLNPPEMVRYLGLTWGRPIRGRRHIGYWAWELPDPPKSWRSAFRLVDEVWAPSAFTAEALRKIAPAGVPIRVVPHPVHLATPATTERPARHSADGFRVLAALDIRSTFARKNLDGIIEIIKRCSARAPGQVQFVLKVTGSIQEPGGAKLLHRRLAGAPDVTLIEKELSLDDMAGLIAASDAILSPHRAEGFGLLLGEALDAGKPVVATNWSGNVDFMDSDCSVMLDYTLTAVNDPQGRYRNSYWAEPDLDQAVDGLLKMARDRDYAEALGREGQRHFRAAMRGQDWFSFVSPSLAGGDVPPPGRAS